MNASHFLKKESDQRNSSTDDISIPHVRDTRPDLAFVLMIFQQLGLDTYTTARFINSKFVRSRVIRLLLSFGDASPMHLIKIAPFAVAGQKSTTLTFMLNGS